MCHAVVDSVVGAGDALARHIVKIVGVIRAGQFSTGHCRTVVNLTLWARMAGLSYDIEVSPSRALDLIASIGLIVPLVSNLAFDTELANWRIVVQSITLLDALESRIVQCLIISASGHTV